MNDETRRERIVLETERHRIVGDVTLPAEGYRSRVSDLLNREGFQFVPLSNAVITGPSARDPQLRVHFYGKDLRPGRKVGHVNAYGDDLDDVLDRARHAAAWFRGDLGNDSD